MPPPRNTSCSGRLKTLSGYELGRRQGSFRIVLSWLWLAAMVIGTMPGSGAPRRDWTGQAGQFWSTPNNWNPVGTPQDGEELWFQQGACPTVNSMTNDLSNLRVHQLRFITRNYALSGNQLTLAAAQETSGRIEVDDGSHITINCPLQASGGVTIIVGTNFVVTNATSGTENVSRVTPRAWYRLGEEDQNAGSGVTVTSPTSDSAGANPLQPFGSPVYTSAVAPDASAQVASDLGVQLNGNGRYLSNAIVTSVVDNFGIEAWVRPDEVSSTYQFVAYNGNTANNGWGIAWQGGRAVLVSCQFARHGQPVTAVLFLLLRLHGPGKRQRASR